MKGVRIIAMIMLGVLVGYFYRDSAPAVMLERLVARPCVEPLLYALGEVDGRFGVSEERLIATLGDVEALWEDALGIDLFAYAATATPRTIPVNLIYDDRQIQSDISKNVRDTLGSERSSLTAMETTRDELAAEYEKTLAIYNEIRINYEKRLAQYNKTVGEWNKKGGAPKDVYDELEVEGEALDIEMKKVVAAGDALKALAEELNAYNARISSYVDDYNKLVNTYNETFHKETGFAQGTFGSRTINVYQFMNEEELRIVLAHELGHALGLGHVENDHSIMYAKTGQQSLETGLTPEDITHAKEICGIKE